MTPEYQQLLQNLQQYFSEQLGESATITDAKPLAGGASRESWYLKLAVGDGEKEYVLRRDLPAQMYEGALTRDQEFRVMGAAYQHGVKVAKVRFSCSDARVVGSDFFVMDYVEGISIGRKVITMPELAKAREQLPIDMAQELAKIHSMNVDDFDFLREPSQGQSSAGASIAEMYTMLDDLNISNPVWEWTLRWAQNNIPEPNPQTFLHGDFRVGNLLVDEHGLAAVIDWEFGHIGDPDEELGYLCMRDWRFGEGKKRAAGLTDRESFLLAYEAASGRKVNRASVDWWEVMGNIRWGIICMSQADRHLSGKEQSVELISLGRRSAEMQLESLRLIESFGM